MEGVKLQSKKHKTKPKKIKTKQKKIYQKMIVFSIPPSLKDVLLQRLRWFDKWVNGQTTTKK